MDRTVKALFFAAFIIFMLTLFFLSSPRPSFGYGNAVMTMGPAVDISMEMSKEPDVFETWQNPVKYKHWDTSRALEPWYAMFIAQLEFSVVQEEAEAIERRKREMKERAEREEYMKEQAAKNRFWAAAAFFMMILLAISVYFEQYRWKLVDKVIAWRKRKRV